jgi:hypothetical protein
MGGEFPLKSTSGGFALKINYLESKNMNRHSAIQVESKFPTLENKLLF